MASYPATLSDHAQSSGGPFDDAHGDDDLDQEPPPVVAGEEERRMQVRAYNLWTGLLGQRNFPRIEDLASIEMPEFAQNALVLDFSSGIANPAVTRLGKNLARECGGVETIRYLNDIPEQSLLWRITEHYRQLLANQAPVGFEAEFVNLQDKTMVYRGILLPFSNDGITIEHVLGVINWKELADAAVTADLMEELDRSVRAAHAPAAPLLGEWADGPIAAEIVDPDDAASAQVDVGQAADLADRLASAQELARIAIELEDRSRAMLHAAIDRVWDCVLAAEARPRAMAEIMAQVGLQGQIHARMMPLLKLAFGDGYDRTRLSEFAIALSHARRQRLAPGRLADDLAKQPGGLKGVIDRERQLRRAAVSPPITAPCRKSHIPC